MRVRLSILVLGVALGLAARGVKWAYDQYVTEEKPTFPEKVLIEDVRSGRNARGS